MVEALFVKEQSSEAPGEDLTPTGFAKDLTPGPSPAGEGSHKDFESKDLTPLPGVRSSASGKNTFAGKTPAPSAFGHVAEVGDARCLSMTHVIEIADVRLTLTRLIAHRIARDCHAHYVRSQ